MTITDGDAALIFLMWGISVALVVWEWVVNHQRDRICSNCSACKLRAREAKEDALKKAGRCTSCGWLVDIEGRCKNDRCREH